MSYERNFQIGAKAVISPRDIIRLWPDGPPTKLEGVGPEGEFRAPVGTVGDAAMATTAPSVVGCTSSNAEKGNFRAWARPPEMRPRWS